MKKKTAIMMAIFLGLGAVFFGGCTKTDTKDAAEGTEAETEETEEMDEMDETQTQNLQTEDEDREETAGDAGINAFAFRLTRACLEQKGEKENLLLSPFSVWLPLAALTNAADEAAQEELTDALGMTGKTAGEINEWVLGAKSVMEREEDAKQAAESGASFENPLKIADAIFVDAGAVLDEKFEQIFDRYYRGKVFQVDFAGGTPDGADAVGKINDWAEEQTGGKVRELVTEFDPLTRAAIADAVCFSDSWTTEFWEENTYSDIFYGAAGQEEVPFLYRQFDRQIYYEGEHYQACVLFTRSGGAMILLLPQEGTTAEQVLADMDTAALQDILGADRATVQLSLPKFRLESGPVSLLETLSQIGVPLTDPNHPHITGLVRTDVLFLSQVVQKSMLEVDEKGLTAAAATVAGMELMSAPVEIDPVEMKCDRPFAFLLTADSGETDPVVLFSGVVNHIEE